MLEIKVFNYQTDEFQETELTPETRIQCQCIIGRSASCDLVLNSSEVSRVHGRIIFQNGQYYFTDLGSKNGSRINNKEAKANQSYVLKEEDVIHIADNFIVIEALKTSPSGEDATYDEELAHTKTGRAGDHRSPAALTTAPTCTCFGLDTDRRWTEGDLTVRCVGAIDETRDVKTFCFVAEPPVLFTYKPGQFVTLELEVNGVLVFGSYSISSTPSRPLSLEITVKRVPTLPDASNVAPGLVDNWLYDHITVGGTVKLIGGPMGNFTYFAKPEQKLLMISAGRGIIPIMSMLRWVYDTSASGDIVFFHSARSPRDIIFRQELELMATRIPNFRLAITTTREESGQTRLGKTGRLTEAMLLEIAPDLWSRTVYVCGPDSFMQAVKAMLESRAFPMQNYYSQTNGAANTDNYTSKTALKDLPIPPAEPLTNERRVATDLVPNSPFSTGLPALDGTYATVGRLLPNAPSLRYPLYPLSPEGAPSPPIFKHTVLQGTTSNSSDSSSRSPDDLELPESPNDKLYLYRLYHKSESPLLRGSPLAEEWATEAEVVQVNKDVSRQGFIWVKAQDDGPHHQ